MVAFINSPRRSIKPGFTTIGSTMSNYHSNDTQDHHSDGQQGLDPLWHTGLMKNIFALVSSTGLFTSTKIKQISLNIKIHLGRKKKKESIWVFKIFYTWQSQKILNAKICGMKTLMHNGS